MSQENKSDSGIPSGAGDNAAAKTDSTGSAKAAARKKQHQQRNQKANPPAKKKPQPQQQPAKSSFKGIASGTSPMTGVVIAQGNGNMAGQFRVFQKKLAGAAADDKAYGLDSAILDLVAKKRTDFVKTKPDPSIHSKMVPELDSSGDPTGGNKVVCFNPFLKEQMDAEYNMELKFQLSNWNQYNRMEEGYYRTALGNIDANVITYCRMDKRMTMVESNKDLVLLLLVLRSVCAQNHGAMKVDDEYQNLGALHSAIGYRQKKNSSDAAYADEVLDRYGSALFTNGKFIFGQSVYDKVLANYKTPMSFKEYIVLKEEEQIPIDLIVKERTVARLIIKNSLNERVREELAETYSVTNSTCYPNTISEALSLLATFKKVPNKSSAAKADDDAIVSYHENIDHDDIADDSIEDKEISIEDKDISIDIDIDIDDEKDTGEDKTEPTVKFEASVMAAIIAEATAEDNEDQFFGVNFEKLQEVGDAYAKDEPDNVCCAHVIDTTERVTDSSAKIEDLDHQHGFELIIYHTAQRVNNQSDVFVVNYDANNPSLISHEYNRPCAESIIDYSDALRLKLNLSGIHDSTDLMNIFEDHDDKEASAVLKRQLNDVNQVGLKTSTVRLLKEETIRHVMHTEFNSLRYNQMVFEIGDDVEMEIFPQVNILLHHVVSAVAINQNRRKPNRWVNKVTHKLIVCNIKTVEQLESKLSDGTLNDHIGKHELPRLNQVTIHGFKLIMGTADFRQGRS
jgi:hypothetical protein